MKKFTLIILTATLSFAACQEVETTLVNENVLSAVIEQDEMTRTEMDENNNVLWNENDQIIAFLKTSYGHKYQVKPSFVGKSYADFSMVSSNSGNDLSAGNEWEHNVAYYPYSETVECLRSGDNYILDVVLPSEQSYTVGSFSNGSMAMVAVSEDNNIIFKNILGGIKFQLKGTQRVKSIVLQGKNNEKLSGLATVTAYTDDTNPTITMDSDALSTITLNCGEGVQLNENSSTEFTITLPPILFSKGFTVTVTDSESNTYILETDKANTILRSSLLYMPARNLSNDDYYDDTDIEPSVPVESIKLNQSSLVLKEAFSYKLLATIIPSDATNQNIAWSSSNSSIVTVDNNGIITTLSAGTVNITAEITGMIATCKVKVIPLTTRVMIDYVENGVNYGKGIAIGDIIWAPVNCDFLPDSYSTSKFFQWGRKFGQISWKEDLEFIEGPISLANAQRDIYKDIVFVDTSSPYDWISEYNDLLWNRGTDQTPLKSEYDPCPDGWRVPTHNELSNLKINYGNIYSNKGTDFSGEYTYLDGAPMICLPITGYRDHLGNAYTYNVSAGGEYWSSYTKEGGAYFLYFKGRDIKIKTGSRCDGRCIRCVQE